VSLEDRASIWFGSRLDATNGASITIGTCSNIQDNSVLYGGTVGITIGAKTTLGHNVRLTECTIGDRCLIGIGSIIAPGTVIEDDNFVAAGSTTEPGQRLRPGWFWAGRPAQKIAELDEVKRDTIRKTAIAYHLYAREFDSVKSAVTD
jgi:carbonic anhydrase/acetyltransferase-like protein (isoleucine patch superfamily)